MKDIFFWVILGLTIFLTLLSIFGDWIVHLSQNKKYKTEQKIKWITFNQFKTLFYSYKYWKVDNWKYSFFSSIREEYNIFQIHANIVTIGGITYNLYPISYLRFYKWRKKEWTKRTLWNSEVQSSEDLINSTNSTIIISYDS